MGGALLGASRMPKEKFEEMIKKFIPELEEALSKMEDLFPGENIKYQIVPYYSEKEDFGDLDIIVRANTDVVRDAIIKYFGFIPLHKLAKDHRYSTNHNCFSFCYNTERPITAYDSFQIDLICTVADYKTTIAYYSYNDVGNILGRFFHKFGLKYGHQGLMYPLRDERGIRKEILVSNDQTKILEFLGLNPEKWNNGFTTLEDIFEWVATGRYFDPTIFNELSAINEKRDRKRKTFSKFLDWLEKTKPKPNYSFFNKNELDVVKECFPNRNLEKELNTIEVWRLDDFFGSDIAKQVKEFDVKMEREKKIKEKFNGEIVMEITGLKGKDVGAFMNKFKEHDYDGSFDDYILDTDPELIKQYIKTVFELQK